MGIIQRLRQRKLAQWGVAYLAAAWVVLQVLQYLSESFGWPAQVVRFATIFAGVEVLAAFVLAWFHGEEGQQRFRVLEIVLLLILVTIGGSVGWALRGPRAPEASISLPVEQNSIAVLPFEDLRGGTDQDYFSDGIAEEILNALAKTPGLRVAARASAFSFRGKGLSIEEIARKLRVAHVLEGTVRKDSTRVRVTVELIDAATGYHLWSDKFDHELKDVFRVQDEVSRAIVDKLKIQLASTQTVAAGSSMNPEAYDLYLRGRYFWAKRTPDGIQRAIKYFEQAVQIDSSFAAAHANLAGALLVLPIYVVVRPEVVRPRARTAVRNALALDSALADAWAARAYVNMSYDHDWQNAEVAFHKALHLKPNDSNTLVWYGDFSLGHNRKGFVAAYERAVQVDPLSAAPRFSLGWGYMIEHRWEDAVAQLQRAIELDPALVDSYTHLGRARVFQGRYDEGIRELEDAVNRSQRRAFELGALGFGYATAGRTEDARKLLTELETRRKSQYVSAIPVAMIYTALRDNDHAFAALEQARKDGDMWLTENNPDPAFEALHSDKRWNQLLKRLGISR